MAVKIRLTRHGSKKRPYYHIVVADSTAPRDGRFIESIGAYNPNTNPPTVNLDFDKALDWYQKGAVPTDTVRSILSQQGVLLKNHLIKGVKKGAITEEQCETRYQVWKKQSEASMVKELETLRSKSDTDAKKRMAAESKVREARAQELARKNSELAKKLGVMEQEAEAEAVATAAANVDAPVENE